MALDNRMNKSVFQKLGIPWLGWYAFRRGAAHISVARYEPQFRRRSGDSATRPKIKSFGEALRCSDGKTCRTEATGVGNWAEN